MQADATAWRRRRQFDAVLLDAPCSATGTIRRHPDVPHIKRPRDVQALTAMQDRLLAAAAALLRPGGRLFTRCARCSRRRARRALPRPRAWRAAAGAVHAGAIGGLAGGALARGLPAHASGDVAGAWWDGWVLRCKACEGLKTTPAQHQHIINLLLLRPTSTRGPGPTRRARPVPCFHAGAGSRRLQNAGVARMTSPAPGPDRSGR